MSAINKRKSVYSSGCRVLLLLLSSLTTLSIHLYYHILKNRDYNFDRLFNGRLTLVAFSSGSSMSIPDSDENGDSRSLIVLVVTVVVAVAVVVAMMLLVLLLVVVVELVLVLVLT